MKQHILRRSVRVGLLQFVVLAFFLGLFQSRTAQAATVVVTNTANSGAGSLRAALITAAGSPNTTINFNIPGTPTNGVFTIRPTGELPDVSGSGTIIDGTSQTAIRNSNPLGPEIEIDVSQTDFGAGLNVTANNCVIKGLAINNFWSFSLSFGIQITGSSNRVSGCYMGIDATGRYNLDPASSFGTCIRIQTGGSNVIGGTTSADRNVLSATGRSSYSCGVYITDSDDNIIRGNYIGTNASGQAVSNLLSGYYGQSQGIYLNNSDRTIIGGTTTSARNIISGNGTGIRTRASSYTTIQGNYIGTDASGSVALAEMGQGIHLTDGTTNTQIGGTVQGAENLISGGKFAAILLSSTTPTSNCIIQGNNIGTDANGTGSIPNSFGVFAVGDLHNVTIGGTGTREGNRIVNCVIGIVLGNAADEEEVVYVPSGIAIRGNSISKSSSFGIDLGNTNQAAITPNDDRDADTGPNGLQNYPVLTAASVNSSGASTSITGTLNSRPSRTYLIDFYANTAASTSGYGEGEIYLGSTTVTTDGSGNASIDYEYTGNLNGKYLSATAIDRTLGDTSEFSQAKQVVSTQAHTPSVSSASTLEDTQTTSGLVVTRSASDGTEIPYVKITEITNGTLFQNNGTTAINNGDFITFTQGGAGLRFRPAANFYGTGSFKIQASSSLDDSGLGGSAVTASITVTPVNDAPTLNSIGNRSVAQNSGAQTVNLAGIGAGPNETQILTVSASSSNTALIPIPSVTYTSPNSIGTLTYTPVAGQTGTATITVRVQDNGGTANGGIDITVQTFTVTVSGSNKAPTLNPIANPAAILEDSAQQTVSLSGITAGASETQTLTLSASSSNPALIPTPSITYTSPNTTGTLRYTPVANQSGTAVITVTVTDNGGTANGGVNTISRTFTVTVTPVNDAPTLNTIANPASVLEDSGNLNVNLANITAGAGETQTLTVTAGSSNPTLFSSIEVGYSSPSDTGSLTLRPAPDQSGSATITVRVQDDGDTANGGANNITRTFTATVTPVNDAPTLNAIADPATIQADQGQQTLGLNGISPGPANENGQAITITATSDNPALIPHPTITYTSPAATAQLRYTPVVTESGTATITVQVRDNGGTDNGGVDTVTRTFLLTILPAVDDAPVAQPATVTTPEDAAKSITLVATDPENQSLQYEIIDSPSHGALTGVAPNLTYTPAQNYNGSDSFTFKVNDGTHDSATATVGISVTAVNDAPVATAATISTLEDNAKAIVLNATDVDSASLTYTVLSSPRHGTLSGTAPNLIYTPTGDYYGTDYLLFRAGDGITNSNTATITINVTPVNDAPLAQNQSVGVQAGQPLSILLAASDMDSSALTYRIVTAPAHGTLSGTAPNLSYTSATNFSGNDSFAFIASDGDLESNLATVSIQVGSVNTVPVAVADTFTTSEDTALNLDVVRNDLDSDGDALRVARFALTAQSHGTISFNADGTLLYVPEANFNGTALFSYTVTDGSLESSETVSITVQSVNDAPLAQPDSYRVDGAGLTVAASGVLGNDSDTDGDLLTAVLATSPTNGSVMLNPDGSFNYAANNGFNGIDSFTYRATDGILSSLGTVTLTVSGNTTPTNPSDTSAPTVALAEPLNGSRSTQFTAIRGIARDRGFNGIAASGVQRVLLVLRRASDGRYWNGGAWVAASTNLQATLSGPAEARNFRYAGVLPTSSNLLTGVYYLSVVAFDSAGNRGAQNVSFRVVDLTAPVVAITAPRAGIARLNLGAVTGTLTEEATGSGPARVILSIRRSSDGASWNGARWVAGLTYLPALLRGTGSHLNWTATGLLPAAPSIGRDNYIISAFGYDRAGNRGVATVAVTVVAATGANATVASRVVLSTVIASATTQSVTLQFSGALDANAVSDADFAVSVNGESVSIEGTSCDGASNTVALSLTEGSLQTGDKVDVAWKNLLDSKGAVAQGQVTKIAQ